MKQGNTQNLSRLLEAGLELFRDLIVAHPELSEALDSSKEEFSEWIEDDDTQPSAALRRARHFEWFLFEREATDFSELFAAWREFASPELLAQEELFAESITGVFEVQGVDGESGIIDMKDLAGLTRLQVSGGETGEEVSSGDLIVGRLFPVGPGLYIPSSAHGQFRSPVLIRALKVDLETLRAERPHAVMRLSQRELERMFWPVRPKSESEPNQEEEAGESRDAVGELREFLSMAGLGQQLISSWLYGLSRIPYDESTLITGAGDYVGQVLEELAFNTEVDLGRARELFLHAWPALHGAESATGPQQNETAAAECSPEDVANSLAEFDRDRAAGIDVETSIRELTKRLGIDVDELDEDSAAPDFPGVVGAMIEEFLWEIEQEEGAELRKAHEGLRVFGSYANNIGVFENLGRRQLLSFAAFWLPESRQLKNGAEAERMMRALKAFASWSEKNQGVELLKDGLDEVLDGLTNSLPRVVNANALLAKNDQITGELFEFLGVKDESHSTLRDARGESRAVAFDQRLHGLLQEGDLLRGQTADTGEFQVACCYPPEADQLKQSLI